MEHTQHIIEATQEIFSKMIMLKVTAGDPYQRKDERLRNSISGIIGLAGNNRGMLAIHLPNSAALAVTTAFLGTTVTEIDNNVRDAIGELANMLGGRLKSVLDPGGSNIQLSMPSAIHGDEYAIDFLADAETMTVPFSFQDQKFAVELQLKSE